MHNYYGTRTWQIGAILVAGSLVTTGLSLDPKFAGLRPILLAIISMTAVIFWGFFSMRNRTIWRRHQDRARNIEDSLRVLFASLPAGDPMTGHLGTNSWCPINSETKSRLPLRSVTLGREDLNKNVDARRLYRLKERKPNQPMPNRLKEHLTLICSFHVRVRETTRSLISCSGFSPRWSVRLSRAKQSLDCD